MVIKEKVIKEDITTPPKDIKIVKWWGDIGGYMKLWRASKYPERKLLITMDLDTGRTSRFYIVNKGKVWHYSNEAYVVDEHALYYDATYNVWCLDYHEHISIPIKRPTKKDLIKRLPKDITSPPQIDAESLNQLSLSTVIEKVVQGSSDDAIKKLQMFMWIIIILVVLMFVMMLKLSGGFGGLLS